MPLLYCKNIASDSVLGVWKITESLETLKNTPVLEQYIEDLKMFKSIKRQQEWLATRLLLHTLFPSTELEICYTNTGKPLLKNCNWDISISHTDGIAALIVSKSNKVSIDIEYISTRVPRIISRFLREDEKFSTSINRVYSYHAIWCAKELLFKLLDAQSVDFKKHLRVLPFKVDINNGGLFYAMQYKDSSYTPRFIPITYLYLDKLLITYTIVPNELR